MKNNLKEIKTTVIGIILMLVGLVFFSLNIHELDQLTWSQLKVPGTFLAGGILFLLAPDRLLDWMFSYGKKKTGTNDNQ